MRVLFMGTPVFAVSALEALLAAGHTVCGVVTREDKPKNRGMQMAFSPVKEAALQADLPVYQPTSLRDEALLPLLSELAPACIVVVAYGKILPRYILDYPAFGCVNVHASILPKYRGASPMQSALLHGEAETGVTTMLMADGIDTGDMLLFAKMPIADSDNLGTVHDTLAALSGPLLIETLEGLAAGTIVPIKQDDTLATHAPLIKKEDCRLHFNNPASVLFNQIRAFYPAPQAWFVRALKTIKVSASYVADIATECLPGQVVRADKSGIYVACSAGTVLCIIALKPEGKKEMTAAEFLNGNTLLVGEQLDGEH